MRYVYVKKVLRLGAEAGKCGQTRTVCHRDHSKPNAAAALNRPLLAGFRMPGYHSQPWSSACFCVHRSTSTWSIKRILICQESRRWIMRRRARNDKPCATRLSKMDARLKPLRPRPTWKIWSSRRIKFLSDTTRA